MAKKNVNIEVTDVRVYVIDSDSSLVANVSITINEVLVIWCKLIEGKRGYFLSFPSHAYKKGKNTEYKDDVFFLDADIRQTITDRVVEEYNVVVETDEEEDAPKQRKRK